MLYKLVLIKKAKRGFEKKIDYSNRLATLQTEKKNNYSTFKQHYNQQIRCSSVK